MTYVRPDFDREVFRDESGRVIDYGHRWGRGQPPEHTYSVSVHPERFRPLHTVAEALIDHLASKYDVSVEETTSQPEWLDPRVPASRSVTLRPTAPDTVSLSVALTDHPGVILLAGSSQRPVPYCGCDACDDDVDFLVGELEDLVLAVAAGRFVEHADGWEFLYADGSGEAAGERRSAGHQGPAWPRRP